MFRISSRLQTVSGEYMRSASRMVVAAVLLLGVTAGIIVARPLSVYAGESFSQDEAVDKSSEDCVGKDCSGLITTYVDPFIKLLSGLVGIVVTISVIAAGIQYSMARDETRSITVAKHRIEKALTALLAYLLLVAFLQWLIPGGVI